MNSYSDRSNGYIYWSDKFFNCFSRLPHDERELINFRRRYDGRPDYRTQCYSNNYPGVSEMSPILVKGKEERSKKLLLI